MLVPKAEVRQLTGESSQATGRYTYAIAAGIREMNGPALTQLKKTTLLLTHLLTLQLGFSWGVRKRFLDHLLGGLVVALQMRRRHGEHGSQSVETMPSRIFVKSPGGFGIKDHPQQIVESVHIFGTTQTMMRDRPTPGLAGSPPLEDGEGDLFGDLCKGLRGGLRLLGRWHFRIVHAKSDFRPHLGGFGIGKIL